MMIAMGMISVGMITNLPIHLLCTKGEDLAVLLLEDINIRMDGALWIHTEVYKYNLVYLLSRNRDPTFRSIAASFNMEAPRSQGRKRGE